MTRSLTVARPELSIAMTCVMASLPALVTKLCRDSLD